MNRRVLAARDTGRVTRAQRTRRIGAKLTFAGLRAARGQVRSVPPQARVGRGRRLDCWTEQVEGSRAGGARLVREEASEAGSEGQGPCRKKGCRWGARVGRAPHAQQGSRPRGCRAACTAVTNPQQPECSVVWRGSDLEARCLVHPAPPQHPAVRNFFLWVPGTEPRTPSPAPGAPLPDTSSSLPPPAV